MNPRRHVAALVHLVLLGFFSVPAWAALVSGKITDENNEPLPFVSVYLEGTTRGVTSNKEGQYSVELPAGDHALIFQFIGYKRHAEQVHVKASDEKILLNVQMEPQPYEMAEVTIRADAEDPAYAVMRKAIKMRKYYLNQIQSYSCDVYIKGLQRVTSYPKKFMGFDVNAEGDIDPKTGIFYLSESVSRFYFEKPDKTHEEMISSKVSGKSKAFSFNRTSDLLLNFYENIVPVQVVSKRGFVSPLAEDALFYYNYHFAGTFYENGKAVNKIEVIPKRAHDPVFRGYLYICENTWRIHSTDLYLVKDAGIQFVDTLKINQLHLPVKMPPGNPEVWMLFSNKLGFTFSLLGFKGNGLYLGVHSNYHVVPDGKVRNPLPEKTASSDSLANKKYRRRKRKDSDTTYKAFHPGELMKIDREANKKDSSYWAEIRPVPLTAEEISDYRKKDSIQTVHESKSFLDSVDRKTNKFHAGDLLFGYSHTNRYKKRTISFSPLIQNVQFNTVQGWVIASEVEIRRRYEQERRLYKTVSASYGFADKRVNAYGKILYEFNPGSFTHSILEGGRQTVQFSDKQPISPLVNTLYSLLEERNYLKLYQKDFLKLSCNSELANGVYLRSSLEYSDRSPLMNTTYYSLVNKSPGYTSNDPLYPQQDSVSSFHRSQSMELRVNLRLRYRQRYVTRPDEKWVYGSKYPTVHLEYRKGIPALLGSDVNYDLLKVSITDRMNFKLLGKASYLISAGKFVNRTRMDFMDYYHFSGNKTIFSNFDFSDFQLLDYYTYSTNEYFAEAHYEHDFSGFILNKFPLLRNLKLNELAGIHYLYTEKLQHYAEVFCGLEKFNLARADFVVAFSNAGKIASGFRIGLKLGRR